MINQEQQRCQQESDPAPAKERFHDFPAADFVQDFMMAVQPEFQGHVEMADLFQRFCDDEDTVTEISDGVFLSAA